MHLLSKAFRIFVIVTGILTAIIVVYPGTVFVGIMFARILGWILITVPMAFVVSATFLIGDLLLREHGRAVSLLAPALVLVAIGIASPVFWNRSANAELRKLSEGDRSPGKLQISAKTIALLTPDTYRLSRIKPTECIGLCQRLLFNGSAEAVLTGQSPVGLGEPSLTAENSVMRHRIERRSSCPSIYVPEAGGTDDERMATWGSYYFISDRTRRRIAAGECLISEQADVSQADIVIVDQPVKHGTNPCDHPWDVNLDTISAKRLSIYERKDGSAQKIFQQTWLEAYPIFMPLFVAPDGHCPSDVVTGIGRKRLSIAYYDLLKFLKASTNLNVEPFKD